MTVRSTQSIDLQPSIKSIHLHSPYKLTRQRNLRSNLGLKHLAQMCKMLGVKGNDNNQNLDSQT